MGACLTNRFHELSPRISSHLFPYTLSLEVVCLRRLHPPPQSSSRIFNFIGFCTLHIELRYFKRYRHGCARSHTEVRMRGPDPEGRVKSIGRFMVTMSCPRDTGKLDREGGALDFNENGYLAPCLNAFHIPPHRATSLGEDRHCSFQGHKRRLDQYLHHYCHQQRYRI